jgi:DNA-binding response OmpR family regulator
LKILIADDDRAAQMLLAGALRSLGHSVQVAGNGDEAWDLLQKEHFEVLVSDWLMPGLDGPALCRRVREQTRPRYTYIILLTLLEGRGRYVEGIEAGADDFLTKPFDVALLGARLRVAERILGLQEEVRQLTGLLPICSYCKMMRDQGNEWVTLERYITRRTEASFTHGICPTCVEERFKPELARLTAARDR